MKKLRWDLLLVLGVLLAAGIIWLWERPGGEGGWAVVTIRGQETARYPLSEDVTVTIGGEEYNILRIEDGAAAVIEANCADHTCVRTGSISREGEMIVCLPHGLVVEIAGGEAADWDAAVG